MPKRLEVQEQDTGGQQVCKELSAAGKKSARCAQEEGGGHLSVESVNAEEEDKCAQQSA